MSEITNNIKEENTVEVNNINIDPQFEMPKANVKQKLAKARVMLQDGGLKKSGRNNHKSFSYFELSDFLPSVNDIFEKLGLIAIFELETETAKLLICDVNNDEDMIVFYTPIKEADIQGATPIQNLGGTHTYIKKYLYMNALEIAEMDIVDSSIAEYKAPAKKQVKQERSDKEKLDYESMINKVTNVEELNIAYTKCLSEMKNEEEKAKAKILIKTKAEQLNAVFDKNFSQFMDI